MISEAYTACNPSDSSRESTRILWEIYTPDGLDSWTLPTPASGWPRAGLGGDLAGLIDPNLSPEDDLLRFESQTIFQGIASGFDYDEIRLFDFRSFVTHVTTNTVDY